MLVEHREDGYYVDLAGAETEPTWPRWNAKLIPIAGWIRPPDDRIRAAYKAIENVTQVMVTPSLPVNSDQELVELAHGFSLAIGEQVSRQELQAVLNMRLGDLKRIVQGS